MSEGLNAAVQNALTQGLEELAKAGQPQTPENQGTTDGQTTQQTTDGQTTQQTTDGTQQTSTDTDTDEDAELQESLSKAAAGGFVDAGPILTAMLKVHQRQSQTIQELRKAVAEQGEQLTALHALQRESNSTQLEIAKAFGTVAQHQAAFAKAMNVPMLTQGQRAAAVVVPTATTQQVQQTQQTTAGLSSEEFLAKAADAKKAGLIDTLTLCSLESAVQKQPMQQFLANLQAQRPDVHRAIVGGTQ